MCPNESVITTPSQERASQGYLMVDANPSHPPVKINVPEAVATATVSHPQEKKPSWDLLDATGQRLIKLKKSVISLLSAVGDKPYNQFTMPSVPDKPKPSDRPPVPDKPEQLKKPQVAVEAILASLGGFPEGTRLLPHKIDVISDPAFILSPIDNARLVETLKKRPELTIQESSGWIFTKGLTKPFKFEGEITRAREIEKIDIKKVGTEMGVALPNGFLDPGRMDFHTHIISPQESMALDDHITVADVRAIVQSPGWIEPGSRNPDQQDKSVRYHCIISIMTEKTSLRRSKTRAVFTFFKIDLLSDSAQKGVYPYGLSQFHRNESLQLEF